MSINFEILKKQILSCKICKERFGFMPRPVFHGNKQTKIMQISQAPSHNVSISGKPFDDLSGKRLITEWYQITDKEFYNKNNFYITSMAHCYPGKLKSGGDRLPPKICSDKWLMKEMEVVESEIIILIGRTAASYFFPNGNYTDLIFNDNFINDKLTIILPHPSPLNIKWFKDNPRFNDIRILEIRKIIHSLIK